MVELTSGKGSVGVGVVRVEDMAKSCVAPEADMEMSLQVSAKLLSINYLTAGVQLQQVKESLKDEWCQPLNE